METFLLAQILGAIGSTAFLIGVQLKNKRSIIIFLIFNTAVWTLAMFLVGAWSGMVTNTVTLIPALYAHHINSQRGARANRSYIFAMWLLMFCCWLVTSMQLIDILALVGSSFYMFSLFQKKSNAVRKLLLINQSAWIIYDFAMQIYTGAFFGVAIFVSTLVALYRYRADKPRKRKRYYYWHHHPTHR
ncbi:MAG: YgjV family protein [Candidatus Nomurabacteria bacterium]|jgi:type IV secretory pathway TrbD component|nr:YgjV family protein [Candidatus Nomurabacteria bacterium]